MRIGGSSRLGDGTLLGGSAYPLSTDTASATLVGTAFLTAAGSFDIAGSATLAGIAELVAAGNRTRSGSAEMAGVGILDAAAHRFSGASSQLIALAILEARANAYFGGKAALAGLSVLEARGASIRAAQAALAGTAHLIAQANKQFSGSATLIAEASIVAYLEEFYFDVADAEFYWDALTDVNPTVSAYSLPQFDREGTAFSKIQQGAYRALIRDIPRIEFISTLYDRDPALLLEGPRINKTIYNHGYLATGLTGWTKVGPAAATLTVVDDTAELARAGLLNLVPDARVLRLDAAPGEVQAVNAGIFGNTNPHAFSVFARGVGSAYISSNTGAASGPVTSLGSAYKRISAQITPSASSGSFVISATAGSVVYFVLAQAEEGPYVTSPIPNSTSSTMLRVGETFCWTNPPAWARTRAWYFKFRAAFAPSANVAGVRIAELSTAAGGVPRLALRYTATGIDLLLDNGTAQTTAAVAAAITNEAFVEIVVTLNTAGSGVLAAAVSEGAVVSAAFAAPAGGAPPLFERLWLNSSSTNNVGRGHYLQAKAVNTIPGSNAAAHVKLLREFNIAPNGLVLTPGMRV